MYRIYENGKTCLGESELLSEILARLFGYLDLCRSVDCDIKQLSITAYNIKWPYPDNITTTVRIYKE